MNISFVNVEVRELSSFVITEGAAVADTIMLCPNMSLQPVGGESFVRTFITLELDILVPSSYVSLQVGLLRGRIIA